MPAPLARSVRDLIKDLIPDTTYSSLKYEVLRRNMQSAESRFRTLTEDEYLGDWCSSKFLRRLRELSDSFIEDSPLNLQSILAPTTDARSLDQIAVIADNRIFHSASF